MLKAYVLKPAITTLTNTDNPASWTSRPRRPDLEGMSELAAECALRAGSWGMGGLAGAVWAHWLESLAHGLGSYLASGPGRAEARGAFSEARSSGLLADSLARADMGAVRPYFRPGALLLARGDYAGFTAWALGLRALRAGKAALARARAGAPVMRGRGLWLSRTRAVGRQGKNLNSSE